jgi:cytidylate kinase
MQMNPHVSSVVDTRLRAVLSALRLEEYPRRERAGEADPPRPFITISRQGGAGGWTLAERLVERLNELQPDAEHPWTSWDRELVERVASDHQISTELIESLEAHQRSWLEDLFAGMSFEHDPQRPDEFTVYRRVATTVRALAQLGRVVIVGRGGVCITRNMPGGVRIRLVAPLDERIAFMMRKLNVPHEAAVARVRELDRSRESFYRRHWPTHPLTAELFTVTFNTANLSEEQLAECVLPLVVPQGMYSAAKAGR